MGRAWQLLWRKDWGGTFHRYPETGLWPRSVCGASDKDDASDGSWIRPPEGARVCRGCWDGARADGPRP